MTYKAIRAVEILLILASVMLNSHGAVAGKNRNMGGWGSNDPYNKLYDVKEF